MNLNKHILLSNILMLLIPFIALNFGLYSNQIEVYYQYKIQTLKENKLQKFQIKRQFVQKISNFQRYILSHIQFDGLQFFTNQYNYQPNFAFMKGYTTIIKIVRNLVGHLYENFNMRALIKIQPFLCEILILILINKILFSYSAKILKKIAFKILDNNASAQKVSLFFIYNPVCIFFHSVYSESFYTLLTFNAIYFSLQKYTTLKVVGLLFIATIFRSNGIFLSTIIGIPLLYQLWQKIRAKQLKKSASLIIKGLSILIIIVSPFIVYQYYLFLNVCQSEVHLLNTDLSFQCSKIFPNIYSYLQKRYWNVGLFTYFKLQNLIFILIGLPAILISSIVLKLFRNQAKQTKSNIRLIGLYFSYFILFVITFALTNIQSSTRFFASHPVFYFILFTKKSSKLIKLWVGSYYFMGGILFCIGFPWT